LTVLRGAKRVFERGWNHAPHGEARPEIALPFALRLVILGLERKGFPCRGVLEGLTKLSELQKVVVALPDIAGFSLDNQAMRPLSKERRDIEIHVGRQSVGGVQGCETGQEDANWNGTAASQHMAETQEQENCEG
jgi:hypothetical protein